MRSLRSGNIYIWQHSAPTSSCLDQDETPRKLRLFLLFPTLLEMEQKTFDIYICAHLYHILQYSTYPTLFHIHTPTTKPQHNTSANEVRSEWKTNQQGRNLKQVKFWLIINDITGEEIAILSFLIGNNNLATRRKTTSTTTTTTNQYGNRTQYIHSIPNPHIPKKLHLQDQQPREREQVPKETAKKKRHQLSHIEIRDPKMEGKVRTLV